MNLMALDNLTVGSSFYLVKEGGTKSSQDGDDGEEEEDILEDVQVYEESSYRRSDSLLKNYPTHGQSFLRLSSVKKHSALSLHSLSDDDSRRKSSGDSHIFDDITATIVSSDDEDSDDGDGGCDGDDHARRANRNRASSHVENRPVAHGMQRGSSKGLLHTPSFVKSMNDVSCQVMSNPSQLSPSPKVLNMSFPVYDKAAKSSRNGCERPSRRCPLDAE
jgi:hypothetical protein